MADLTPGAVDALVALVTGDVDIEALPTETKFVIAEALRPDVARATLARVLASLNTDDGHTFAVIARRLGVVESTATRWAKPPAADLRRRRQSDGPPSRPADDSRPG